MTFFISVSQYRESIVTSAILHGIVTFGIAIYRGIFSIAQHYSRLKNAVV